MRDKKQVAAIVAVNQFFKRKEVFSKISWTDGRSPGWMNGRRCDKC